MSDLIWGTAFTKVYPCTTCEQYLAYDNSKKKYSEVEGVSLHLFFCLQIQKMWRGYYIRKYVFNYYSRKRYLEALQVKNEIIRYVQVPYYCQMYRTKRLVPLRCEQLLSQKAQWQPFQFVCTYHVHEVDMLRYCHENLLICI